VRCSSFRAYRDESCRCLCAFFRAEEPSPSFPIYIPGRIRMCSFQSVTEYYLRYIDFDLTFDFFGFRANIHISIYFKKLGASKLLRMILTKNKLSKTDVFLSFRTEDLHNPSKSLSSSVLFFTFEDQFSLKLGNEKLLLLLPYIGKAF
jgi:hypothetical protein